MKDYLQMIHPVRLIVLHPGRDPDAGLFREVTVQRVKTARIAQVYITQQHEIAERTARGNRVSSVRLTADAPGFSLTFPPASWPGFPLSSPSASQRGFSPAPPQAP